MCRQHLLGEHVECHMIAGCISKGFSLSGYIEGGLVDLSRLSARHDALAREMSSRGYAHKSPLGKVRATGGKVDSSRSERELKSRCRRCFTSKAV
jgi:hypothetical protein